MPNYAQSGFVVDDQGRIAATVNAPSGTSTFMDGLAFNPGGSVHTTLVVSGTDLFVNGHRVSLTGQLVVAASAAPLQPYTYIGGWPTGITNGELIQALDVVPGANDPYVRGVRVSAALLGVYMFTGP